MLWFPFVYSRAVQQFARRIVARGELVDALGLGFFAVVGCILALDANQPVSFTLLRGFGNTIAVPVSISLAVGLRLFSVWRGASLPRPTWLHTGAHPVTSDEYRSPESPRSP